MAGKIDGIPRPGSYLRTAKSLGLIEIGNRTISLSNFCNHLLSETEFPPFDLLNSTQTITLTPEIFGHPDVLPDLESTLQLFSQAGKIKKIQTKIRDFV